MSEWKPNNFSYMSQYPESEVLDLGYSIDVLAERNGYSIWYGGEYTLEAEANNLGVAENKKLGLKTAEEILLELLNNVRSAQ